MPNTMLQFKGYPTGRPAFVDPTRVSGISDLVQMAPPTLQGGQPTMEIVGAVVVDDGGIVHLAEEAAIVRDAVEAYRKQYAPLVALPSFKPN